MPIKDQLQFLLVCPWCFSERLDYSNNSIQCCKCTLRLPVSDQGVIDCVLPESKDQELFDFYNTEYIKRYPTLDIQDASWKAETVLALLKETKIKPRRLLDLGCGNGEVLKLVDEGIHPEIAVGVDISSSNLNYALQGSGQFTFIQAAVEHLPFRTGSFDLGLVIDLVEHLEDPKAGLLEAGRVCDYLVVKVPLEDCFEGWLLKKVLPDWKDRFGHINFFNEQTVKEILLNDDQVELISEKLLYTPWCLLGFDHAPFRSKALILARYLMRGLGRRTFSKIHPLWYVALLRTS